MFALDEHFFFLYFFVLRRFGYALPKQQNVGRPTKAVVIVPAKCIFFLRIWPEPPSSKWVRQFAVSIGTKYGGDTTGARFPENIIRMALGNSVFSARLYAVLDAIGTTNHGYKPAGTCPRWCHKCYTTVDEETRFTSHPDNKPPVSRTTEQ